VPKITRSPREIPLSREARGFPSAKEGGGIFKRFVNGYDVTRYQIQGFLANFKKPIEAEVQALEKKNWKKVLTKKFAF